jgi:hypothetical protein
MLGLPKSQNTQAVPGIKETGDTQSQQWTFRRSTRTVLVPKMVGSMMILVPWHEDGGQVDWPRTTPPVE